MNYDEQLRLNAIIRELVEPEGDSFPADHAHELAEALTPQRKRHIFWNLLFPRLWGGSAFEGLTNTGHRASSDDDDDTPVSINNGPEKLWIGPYAVWRMDHGKECNVYIEDRFADTRSTGERRAWALDYKAGQVQCLRRCKARRIEVLFFSLTIQTFRLWKLPCAAEAA